VIAPRAWVAGALALAACGDNLAAPVPDAGPIADARFTGCAAIFHGNFEEAARTHGACATVTLGPDDGVVTLALDLPVTAIATSLAITIALGPAPGPGDYTSETVTHWSATAIQRLANDGVCVYSAGDAVVPRGRFALTLDRIDAATGTAHGSLVLDQRVLQWPGTDCGDRDDETATITF
jgi:hypothetical protein